MNSYHRPRGLFRQYAAANNIKVRMEGLFISYGIAIPVIVLFVVGILMNALPAKWWAFWGTRERENRR